MERTITVTGSGTAHAVPDSARVTVAVVHQAASVADAFAGVASAVERVGEVAREHVEGADIASRGLSVWPSHDQLTGRQAGFECRHTLAVSCPTIEIGGTLLGALVAAVGDRLQVEGVSLVVADASAARATACEAAYDDAVARATHLAGLAGVSLRAAVSIVEGAGGPPGTYVEQAEAFKAMDMGFEPGQTGIGASLRVTFAVEG